MRYNPLNPIFRNFGRRRNPQGSFDFLSVAPRAIFSVSERPLSAFSGNSFLVRRDSDNTTQNIPFTNGVADITALTTFCAGANGFVVTLYDICGTYDVTQATTSKQAKIYDSVTGPILTAAGHLTMRFDTTDEYNRADAFGLTGAPALSVGFCAKWTATGYAWTFGGLNVNERFSCHADIASDRIELTPGPRLFSSVPDTAGYWIAGKPALGNSSTITLEKDGASQSVFSTTAGSHSMLNTQVRIGLNWQGEMSMWCLWNTVLAGSDLTTVRGVLADNV